MMTIAAVLILVVVVLPNQLHFALFSTHILSSHEESQRYKGIIPQVHVLVLCRDLPVNELPNLSTNFLVIR
jgi:hypothetical protein